MRMPRSAAALAAVPLVTLSLVVAGCATAPQVQLPKTTVVLLPDEDGAVGEVSVRTDGGTQQIAEAWAASSAVGRAAPTQAASLGRESIAATYDRLLKAQPPKPKSFVLFFVLDRSVLTAESKALIPEVLEAVRERKPTEITVFGHADAIGTEQRNLRLSADRAREIANLLKKNDPSLDAIDVQSFGDRVPLYPSRANGAEPRNRRVEIQIL